LERINESTGIFEAWSDEPWVNDGASVRVSLVCYGEHRKVSLNGCEVAEIHADLTTGGDLSSVDSLALNKGFSFSGFQMNGPFDIPYEIAGQWLKSPNPHGRPNSDVLRPYANAKDITARSRNQWVIDFTGLTEAESSLYEQPFRWVVEKVKPERGKKREGYLLRKYWRHKRSCPELRKAILGLGRFIATPMVSKYRIFVWLPEIQIPENAAIVIARSDDMTFGILHSRFHELWSLAQCTWMGKGNDPRYTHTTCFETFPFPERLTPRNTADKGQCAPDTQADSAAKAISEAAFKLNQLRENWLNPHEWVDWVITPEEEKAGYPKRPVAKPGYEADLKKRTLTNLYNARPAWLDMAHKNLDKAVAAAYGWDDYTPDMSDGDILHRLLALNLERSKKVPPAPCR
jgi:type II restriction/modification system DNA methylase subunit YeeA